MNPFGKGIKAFRVVQGPSEQPQMKWVTTENGYEVTVHKNAVLCASSILNLLHPGSIC